MRRDDLPMSALRRAAARRRAYFTADSAQIVTSNLGSVGVAAAMALALVTLLSAVARATYPLWEATAAHAAAFVASAAVLAASLLLRRRLSARPVASTAVCLAAEAALLALVVAIDATATHGMPGVFLQPAAIAITSVVVAPYALPLVVALGAEVALALLSAALKSPPVAQFDAFSCAIGMVVAVVVSQVTMHLRLRDFEARERLRQSSLLDELCGVYNKGALVAALREHLALAGPHVSGALFLFDVDRFKQINDTYGHYAGDEVLRAFGRALQLGFRTTDTVGRFGGDEFLVLAPSLVDERVIGEKVGRVRAAMREAGERIVGAPVTLSCGVVWASDCPVTYESALRQADEALYEAKRAGRDRMVTRRYETEDERLARRAGDAEARG